MRLNHEEFRKLFRDRFNGNYHEASRQLGINISQVHRIITKDTEKGAGLLFVGRLIQWCKANGIDEEVFFYHDCL